MKSIFLTSLLIPAIFHVLSASAAPTKHRAGTTTSATSQEKSAVDKAIAYIRGPNADINPACFYSGFTEHEKSKEIQEAQFYLTSHWIRKKETKVPLKCRVILEVVRDFAKANDAHIQDWSGVSKAFAESVSGKVYILLGKTIGPQSVWLKDERQALMNNGKVTEVEVWGIESNGQLKKTDKTKATM